VATEAPEPGPETRAETGDQPSPAVETPAGPAAGAAAGVRSAEARELERQLEEVRQKLREAEQRAQENFDRWARAQADLANFRRRSQFEREELEKYAVATLIASLLPVLDSFDRAWQTLPGELRRLTWLSGVAMINSQLRGILERFGLSEIEVSPGQAYDATLHEAIDREDGEGPPHVLAVFQTGYKLHERVLRPALVKVGPKPPEPAPRAEGAAVEGQGPGSPAAPAAEPSGAGTGPGATGAPGAAPERQP
jgi:molecular chaperone GrpE